MLNHFFLNIFVIVFIHVEALAFSWALRCFRWVLSAPSCWCWADLNSHRLSLICGYFLLGDSVILLFKFIILFLLNNQRLINESCITEVEAIKIIQIQSGHLVAYICVQSVGLLRLLFLIDQSAGVMRSHSVIRTLRRYRHTCRWQFIPRSYNRSQLHLPIVYSSGLYHIIWRISIVQNE